MSRQHNQAAGGEVRTDGALSKPLDARATNLLSTDTGTGTGAFDIRHDGLRDRVYQEAAYAGCAVAKEVELGTEHGLAPKPSSSACETQPTATVAAAERTQEPGTSRRRASKCASTSRCNSRATIASS